MDLGHIVLIPPVGFIPPLGVGPMSNSYLWEQGVASAERVHASCPCGWQPIGVGLMTVARRAERTFARLIKTLLMPAEALRVRWRSRSFLFYNPVINTRQVCRKTLLDRQGDDFRHFIAMVDFDPGFQRIIAVFPGFND